MLANGRAYTACHLDSGDTGWCYVMLSNNGEQIQWEPVVHRMTEGKCTVIRKEQKIYNSLDSTASKMF